ncbi:MAG: DUF3365 domain-containing protein [Epsilonproteobacteria bacterium]|nr:MAG: DUF3365 domain-containing protein [Campylobacterota bacterium]
MKKIFLLLILINFISCTKKQDLFKKQAQDLLKPFKVELKGGLQGHMKKGGPVDALHACNILSPELLKKHNLKGYTIGRTSHKLRNPLNTPEKWLLPLLDEYVPSTMKNPMAGKVIVRDDFMAYVEPIYIQGICLTCHGTNVPDIVMDEIKILYPQDKALDFKLGEFRGFFWVKAPR